jgi:hypothetical protein
MTVRRPTNDTLTIAAIAIAAYVPTNVLHELVGHGGACVLLGGKALSLSSAGWECDLGGVSADLQRWEHASGTAANLLVGIAIVASWRRILSLRSSQLRFFFWLFAVTNLLIGAGTLLFDPLGRFGGVVGDWSMVLQGLRPRVPLLLLVVAAGVALSAATIAWARISLELFLPASGTARRSTAQQLCLVPYVVGCAFFVVAGLMSPHGPSAAFTSAVATFGATALLAWIPFSITPIPRALLGSLFVPRSHAWLVVGCVALVVLLGVLGPGIRFAI